MASASPRYNGDCMKLSSALFPSIIHDVQLGVSGWWFFSGRKDLFVQYVFANNKEVTVQTLLPINMCLLVKYDPSAEPLSVLYYDLIDVVMEMFDPAGAIIA